MFGGEQRVVPIAQASLHLSSGEDAKGALKASRPPPSESKPRARGFGNPLSPYCWHQLLAQWQGSLNGDQED
ncbi:Hypothetical predicted protein [Marmota monax]|uniref:Uncharacterized protein n=1 Tax=Marmota monax TaxID=9995 RepID=A0A5E4BGM8_MARMO|nr:Hypothetical predicted protein [Marmota monax]